MLLNKRRQPLFLGSIFPNAQSLGSRAVSPTLTMLFLTGKEFAKWVLRK
jgi:hypothetical protein